MEQVHKSLETNRRFRFFMTVDKQDNLYLTFPHQNRIEKYSPEGKLLWRAYWDLPYGLEIIDKGKIERKGTSISVMDPRVNRSSVVIAQDADNYPRLFVACL